MKMMLTEKIRAAFLALLVLVTFGRTLNGPFHFDDRHSITENVAVHSIKNLPLIWTDPTTSSFAIENRTYRPLTYTFFTLCWAAGQGSPIPFHLLKLFLHFLMAWVIYLTWKRLWKTPGWFPVTIQRLRLPLTSLSLSVSPENAAFILAGLFAIHPACAECVNYVVTTSSLQCAVFYAWAFYLYLLYREDGQTKNSFFLLLSLFFYFCSVASKEEGITLPAMVFCIEFLLRSAAASPERRLERCKQALRRTLPYIALAFVLLIWLYLMHPAEGDISRGTMSWWVYFITQWKAYLWYMRLWFWPWDLNADYVVFEYSWHVLDGPVIQAFIGNALILIIAWGLRSRFPVLLFGLLWFYITISPASSVVVLGEPVNEHRMYLAYLGFIGATFVLVLSLLEGAFGVEKVEKTLPVFLLLAAVGLFTGSQTRNQVWASERNLWQDTVEKNPKSGRALNNLALVYAGEGEMFKALELLEKCETLWDNYMFCAVNRGWVYMTLMEKWQYTSQGDVESYKKLAQATLERARKINPKSVYANYQLGRFYEEFADDCASAKGPLETAIQLNGDRFPNAQAKLSGCYRKLNLSAAADRLLESAVKLEPENDLVLTALGDAELEKGNFERAFQYFQRHTVLYPRLVRGFWKAAYVELKRKNYSAATPFILKWFSLAPGSSRAILYLAFAAKRTGELTALPELEKRYLSLNPKYSIDGFKAELKKLEGEF